MVLLLEWAEGAVLMGHRALVEWGGLVQNEGFEAQDGAFQKCWAIYPEETMIAALFTKLGHGSNLDVH